MRLQFRLLKPNEIDCRISTISDKGLSLLLYKDARVDQNILDETVGPMNWQRAHSRDNANCTVSIWDDEKKMWVSKEDTGTESFTEAEKGLASDSFKRACFNWGIGRELYTAPFIWIPAKECTIKAGKNGKPACYDKFTVGDIEYDSDRSISHLTVRNGARIVFTFDNRIGSTPAAGLSTAYISSLQDELKRTGVSRKSLLANYGVHDLLELSIDQYTDAMARLEKKPDHAPKDEYVKPADDSELPWNQ